MTYTTRPSLQLTRSSSASALLLALVAGSALAAVSCSDDAEPDPVVGLRMLVEPLFGDTEQVRQHWRIWSDYWTAVVRRPEVAAEYAERIRVWEACLVRVVERGLADGVFHTDDGPQVVALRLAAYSDGVATQIAQGVPTLTNAVALSWMFRFLSQELGIPAAAIAGEGPQSV